MQDYRKKDDRAFEYVNQNPESRRLKVCECKKKKKEHLVKKQSGIINKGGMA